MTKSLIEELEHDNLSGRATELAHLDDLIRTSLSLADAAIPRESPRRPARHAPVSDQTRPTCNSPTEQRLRKVPLTGLSSGAEVT
jgi:hypothetical protein